MSDTGNIRDILGWMIGQRIVDISQKDPEDVGDGYVQLILENGKTIKFYTLDSDLYKAPGCIAIGDPSLSPDVWEPTEEEAAAGNWAVVNVWDDKQPENHVLPTHGKKHSLDIDCWCQPDTEPGPEDHLIVKHKESQV